MKTTLISALCLCLIAAAGAASAQDAMKKDNMAATGSMKSGMTMKQCKDHMAMQKSNMKTDDASMKMDATCNDMMAKHDSMMKNDNHAMPKNGMAASAPMGQ